MNKKRWLLPLLLLVAVVLAACSPAATDETPAATDSSEQPAATPTLNPDEPVSSDDPTATATPEEAAGEFQYGQAMVDKVDVLLLESFPVQVNAIVSGNLNNGCTEIDEITTEQQGNNFVVTVTTRAPMGVACTEALVPFEEVVPLEAVGLPAGDYTVTANGVSGQFALAVDNVLQGEETSDQNGLAEIPLSCLSGDNSRAPYVNLAGGYCLQVPARFRVGDVYPQGPGAGTQGSIISIFGPPLDNSLEPLQAGLSIIVLGRNDGRTLEQWADAATADFPGQAITRTETTLNGELALILDGMPGRTLNRQLYVMHHDQVYQLTLYPTDPGYPQVQPDVDELWQMVLESFTFLPPPVVERYSACPAGGLQGDQNSAPYLNIDGGYCLVYPSFFLLSQQFDQGIASLTTNYVSPAITDQLVFEMLTVTIQVETANGRTLAQVVDEAAASAGTATLTRTPATLGGEAAEIVEGSADGSRHLYAVHGERVYHLVLMLPPSEIEGVAADAARLWEAVTSSFTFTP